MLNNLAYMSFGYLICMIICCHNISTAIEGSESSSIRGRCGLTLHHPGLGPLSFSVSDRGVLNQPVNLFCVLPIPDGDAKRHKVYTGSGNRGPTSSLRDRSCIPCTEVLVVGGYKLRERGN